MVTVDPGKLCSVDDVADLLGREGRIVEGWLRDRGGIVVDRRRKGVSGAQLQELWSRTPPRVLASKAPLGDRRELAVYGSKNKTARHGIHELLRLMRFLDVPGVEQLWELDADAVWRWLSRDRRQWVSRKPAVDPTTYARCAQRGEGPTASALGVGARAGA